MELFKIFSVVFIQELFPKYHIWVRMKREYPEMTEIEAKEIAENMKDFGKWKKLKELKKDLSE